MIVGPLPERMVWKRTPVLVVTICSGAVPTQAIAAPATTSTVSASQSFSTLPLASGRSGTAVTVIGIPQTRTGDD